MSAPSTTTTITVHPYLTDLPVFEAEVQVIAESIREVGLLHPITLDAEGRMIGGRHRLAACERVEVEPRFETHEGDPLAFILHDNATRKHQTTGQRAAEVALSLASADKRQEGRWSYGQAKEHLSDLKDSRLSQCGLILDYLGRDALIAVAEGDRTLNDAYTEAEHVRDDAEDAERKAAAEAEAEQQAKEFIEQNDSKLASKVGKGDIETYREAVALWEQRNREEVERRKKEERDHADTVDRYKRNIEGFMVGLTYAQSISTADELGLRDDVLDALSSEKRDRFLTIEKEIQ